MVFSSSTNLQNLETDTWVKASWEEFMELANHPTYANGKFYYDQGYLKIEMSPIGSSHSQDNGIIYNVLSLYAALKKIRIKGLAIAFVEEALQRSHTEDDGEINRWLLQTFS